jgi:NAD(P)H-hydrate epimerase
MKYLTRKQLKELDRKSIEEYGIPAIVLMENAGRALASESMQLIKRIKNPYAYVICGQGNNGGDGLVAARHLFNNGVKVNIIYTGIIKEGMHKEGEAGVNLRAVLKMKIPISDAYGRSVGGGKEFIKYKPDFKKADVIIDAIFGIGLIRKIKGILKDLIELINKSGKPIIAADVPSGLDCDTGRPLGVVVKARKTVTFGAPKIGFKKKEAKKYIGKIFVADIGIPTFLLST